MRAHGVGHRYPGGTLALEGIDLAIPEGEFVAFIGPSGCGKSTLLSLLAGLETPTEGTIQSAQRPAVVFQEAALYPWKTVLDNVAFGLELRGVGKAERQERATTALKKVHLSRFAKAFPHELSGGMRQRAAIARALVLEPDALFLDEPFAALDAQTRALLQAELLALWQREKMRVVLVTHSLDEALAMADRVVLMAAQPGRILEDVRVEAPRPRDPRTSPVLLALHERLLARLSQEVARVAAVEYDAGWSAPTPAPEPLEEAGSGI
jgi:NitT/TauT family transport system ATP-binding protein